MRRAAAPHLKRKAMNKPPYAWCPRPDRVRSLLAKTIPPFPLAGGRLGWGSNGQSATCIIHRPHYPASTSIRLQADTATQAGGMPPEFPASPLTPCKHVLSLSKERRELNVGTNVHADRQQLPAL